MRIVTLAENTTTDKALMCEHGLSLYIEVAGQKLLFDMGQSDLFYENAKKLNIDLSDVDIAVLSHGHYDHGGGLSCFLQINKKAKVFLSRHAFDAHYHGEKYIGLDVSLCDCDRLVFTDDIVEIADNLTLYSCNEESKAWDIDSSSLSVLHNDKMIPERFLHEQYLLINDNGKKVLISGCSHKGILNISSYFDVDVIVGGFHVSKWDNASLINLSEKLRCKNCDFYTCHCTGVEQYNLMKQNMPRLDYLSTGDTVVL